jgi:undecaprenyl diphosphate synthase
MQGETQKGLHVAIIMDGNGRWATRRGLPRVAGHRAGAAAVRRIVEHAPDVGVGTLTLYAFSSDNWNRPVHEVQAIFSLLGMYLRMEREPMRQRGVRLEVIGRRDRMPKLLLREIGLTEAATAAGRRIHLRVAIDYSSRYAIACAASRALSAFAGGRPPAFPQMRHRLMESLAAETEDVDLLIRTGGESRLSDFLLWESAYAELMFVDRMWPEFGAADLNAALDEFSRRERRFGAVTEPAAVAR